MSRKRPATLQDVADHAGVSRGAASFAMTGRPGVSEATRERVRASAVLLGYEPNMTARNLRKARTGIIAVSLPSIAPTLSYYTEATFGIVEEAVKSGHLVTLVPRSLEAVQLSPANIDGVIVLDPIPNDPTLEKLVEADLPVVSGEKMPPGYGAVQGEVTSDHAGLTREILGHFRDRGATAPAIIVPGGQSEWALSVTSAYREWCREHHAVPRIETVSLAELPEDTISATHTLLHPDDPADAILALTEGSVLNVITSAMDFRVAVGSDLLVAAAVDSPILQLTEPSVTAVNLNPRLFGAECMRMMRALLEGTADSSGMLKHTVPAHLVYRQSTGSGRD